MRLGCGTALLHRSCKKAVKSITCGKWQILNIKPFQPLILSVQQGGPPPVQAAGSLSRRRQVISFRPKHPGQAMTKNERKTARWTAP